MDYHLTQVHPPERKFLLPHACHICEYRAVHQNSLKVHIQTKHMGVTFDCDRFSAAATIIAGGTEIITHLFCLQYTHLLCLY